jgi:hypothetical protein
MAVEKFDPYPEFLADAEFEADAQADEVNAEFDPFEHGFPDDRSFSAWHLTAGLGAVASLATVGIVWWAMATVSSWHLPIPSADRALALEPQPAAAAAATSDPTTIVAKSDRGPAPRSEPMDWIFPGWEANLDRTAKTFVLPEDFAADQTKAWPNQAARESSAPPREANAAPPAADLAPETYTPTHRTFATHRRLASVERDLPRERDQSRTTSPKLHKGFARGSYTEKVVEQGDAGEVKYRYVRRTCTPPHMVDVCYMPADARRSVTVQRY